VAGGHSDTKVKWREKTMKILLLGKGAREHAIAWSLSSSPLVDRIFASPGNPGIAQFADIVKVDPFDTVQVVEFACREMIDLVVIGPEAILVNGIPDALRSAGINVFGPGKEGARLEGSKSFSKDFMSRYNIPTAPFNVCTCISQAEKAISDREPPFIVKADGLAAGKGSFVLDTREEALEISRQLLEEGLLGTAGEKIVIEDCLEGVELTVLAVTDGNCIHTLSPSQDHKRIFDNDKGPNTGGMGAYSPVPWADDDLLNKINNEVLLPTLKGIQKDNIDFRGIIYAGLMIDKNKDLSVIEYNVRFGDPEAQVVLPVLKNDLAEILYACSEKKLSEISWEVSDKWAAGVVLSSGGYPGKYQTGIPVEGLEVIKEEDNVVVFHGGTDFDMNKRIVTSGGRVLTVVGTSIKNLDDALQNAYRAVENINFKNMHYRRDIASKANIFLHNKGGIEE